MTRKIIFASVLLLLVGCQRETFEWPDDNRPNPDGSVRFRLKADDAEVEADGAQTRGIPRTGLEAYGSVCVNVFSHTADYEVPHTSDVKFFQDVKLEQKTPNWIPTTPLFWPVEKKLSFFAYASDVFPYEDAGISFLKSEGRIDSIKYTVPSEVELQPDLLVSSLLNQSETANISLTMQHALACVSFCGTAPEGSTYVKSITLRNVYGEGALALNTSSIDWEVNPKSKGITVFKAGTKEKEELDKDPLDNDYLMKENGYLMMIPQKLTNAAIDVLYWNGVDEAGNKVITYILPVDDDSYATWKPGKKYIYKFGSQSEEDITVVYYERYADGTYGLYYYDNKGIQRGSLNETQKITEAGYGVLTRKSLEGVNAIRLADPGAFPVITGAGVSLGAGSFLYPVDQSANKTFGLTDSTIPVDVYFNGSNQSCGMIVPHFAKGVYIVGAGAIANHAIRTPQQMRNISALTNHSDSYLVNPSYGKVFRQERNLDFSVTSIGGVYLNGSVVDDLFHGTYNSDLSKSIYNVKIDASSAKDIGVFSRNNGRINQVILKASTIKGSTQVGGIVGENWFGGVIDKSQVIGTGNNEQDKITITGTSMVGGIVGANRGEVIGNTDPETATEVTIATVSGWVDIAASSHAAGGVAGYSNKLIKTVLVNGVFVTGPNQMDLVESKITIRGGYYVGGIVGENWKEIAGNITSSGKNMPDVAGIVEITGTTGIGGVVGINTSEGTLNSVNIRLGRHTAMVIKGEGDGVGGIVGENLGTLGVESTTSFISARGNIVISGANKVGGIVGNNNSSNAVLQNCFVYDFQTQGNQPAYYAPKIECTGLYAGGIVGYNNGASITDCGVFSVSQATVVITSALDYAGGISGMNAGGTTHCSVVGRVQVEAKRDNSGGFLGGNTAGTNIKNCWIGNSDGNALLKNAIDHLGLVITIPEGTTFGTPYITGGNYIGGAVGLNNGLIEGITLSDNVIIGRKDDTSQVGDGSNWVGGIVGGNSPGDGVNLSVIKGCKVINKPGRIVVIQGARNLGGIAGLNNGTIDDCHVSGEKDTGALNIIGLGTIGGIVGQGGGHETINLGIKQYGNDHTKILNCSVTGYVTIQGNPSGGYTLATEVGGIVGLNGTTRNGIKNVVGCVVKGAEVGAIAISVAGTAGGIAGTNSGNMLTSDVRNTIITSFSSYAGGIAGQSSSTAASSSPETPTAYRSDIDQCKVYPNVTIVGVVSTDGKGKVTKPGAVVGFIDSTVAIQYGNSNTPNLVSNSGVSVNGKQPSELGDIVGYYTGSATIHYSIKAIP